MSTQVVATLRVVDVRASVEIGFELEFEHRCRDACLRRRPARRSGHPPLGAHRRGPGPGLVDVRVDAIHTLAEHFGVVPDDMPWARGVEVTDPDGKRVRLAERRGGYA